jgi:hypothetical protein
VRAARVAVVAAIGVAAALLLTGCFGPGEDELIAQAKTDFASLADQASAVDVAVLHTLEVEDPASESCGTESDNEHTVFVAAGTLAVQSTSVDERELLDGFELEPPSSGRGKDAEPQRWTEIRADLDTSQRAWVDVDGITASVTIDDGLLVVAVFSPCR